MGKYQNFVERAEQGDKIAQFEVGYAYLLGDGIARNYTEAMRWFERSSQQGYSHAALQIGHMHDYGLGVEANPGEAQKYYKIAADRGNCLASLMNERPQFKNHPRSFSLPGHLYLNNFMDEILIKLDLIKTPAHELSFFESIAIFLKTDSSLLKRKIADHIENNSNQYLSYVRSEDELKARIRLLRGAHHEMSALRIVEDYNQTPLEKIPPEEVAGALEFAALQDLTQSQLFIVTTTHDPSLYPLNPKFKNSPIFIFHCIHTNHYNAFRIKHGFSPESLLQVRDKHLPKTPLILPLRGNDKLLFQVINNLEAKHQALYEKIEKGGREFFLGASLQDKLSYIEVKHRLSSLYLVAANLAQNHGCRFSQGSFLYRSYRYNPTLHPEFSTESPVSFLPSITHNRQLKHDLVIGTLPVTFPVVSALALAGCFISYYTLPLNVLSRHLIALPAQSAYVRMHCLNEIPDHYSAEHCLYIGIAYYHESQFYLAMRYLLEANHRSEEFLPEVQYFIDLCAHYFGSIYGDDLYDCMGIFGGNVELIHKKVLSNRQFSNKQDRVTIYSRRWWASVKEEQLRDHNQFRDYVFGQENPSCGDDYHVRISEIVQQFRIRFYLAHPELRPLGADLNYGVDQQSYVAGLSLGELLACLSKVVPVPREHLLWALSSEQGADAEEYFEGLLWTDAGVSMSDLSAPQYNPKTQLQDEALETLLLVIQNEGFLDCEQMQEQSFATYWNTLHLKAKDFVNIAQMPLILRNPLVYMKAFLKDSGFPTSQRDVYFAELVAEGCDLQKHLARASEFSGFAVYQKNREVFYSMLVTLQQLEEQRPGVLQGFIEEYRKHFPVFTETVVKSPRLINSEGHS